MRRACSTREPEKAGISPPPQPVPRTTFGTRRRLRTIRTGSGTSSVVDRMRRRRIVFSVLAFLLIAVVVFVAVGAWRTAGMPPAVTTALGPARARPKLASGWQIALFLASDGTLWGWGD